MGLYSENIHVSELQSCLIVESNLAQVWACKTLGIRLCVMTGHSKPTAGMEPAITIPESGVHGIEKLSVVKLWSHSSYDGEGKGSEHFSYVCEDSHYCIAVRRYLC